MIDDTLSDLNKFLANNKNVRDAIEKKAAEGGIKLKPGEADDIMKTGMALMAELRKNPNFELFVQGFTKQLMQDFEIVAKGKGTVGVIGFTNFVVTIITMSIYAGVIKPNAANTN